MEASAKAAIASFGSFELNLKSGELRKSGIRVRLPDQPYKILAILIEKHGEVVTREELRRRLWREDTFVDFERGLNRAVNKLREALCDSGESPRFIETIPRHGYRFIMPVVVADRSVTAAEDADVRRSLAILPFTNASGLSDADYFCDGITESLIYHFAELPSLRVMARITVFRYRNSQLDAQTIGRELNVDAVLTGRIMLRGESLVVGAELVDVRDGSLLWGQQYSRQLADLFEIEEEMSRAIFEKLRLTLTQQQLNRVQKRHTSSLEAHEFYLRGVFNLNKREFHAVRRAVEYFQKSLESDPEYALAHSGLADCFAVMSIYPYCFLPPSEAMPRARAAAMRALELDPNLAEAHTTLGLVNLVYDWNFEESEIQFRCAQELKPSYPTVHMWYCLYCIAVGRLDEAQVEARKTHELDPLSPIGCTLPAVATYYNRHFDRAVEELRLVATLEPSYPMVHLFTGYAECAVNRPERATDAFAMALKLLSGDSPNVVALSRLGYAYGLAGQSEKAVEVLRQLEEIGSEKYVPAHARAFVYLGLNRIQQALDAVEEMVREHSDYLIYLNQHTAFDSMRREPRFIAALQRVRGERRVSAPVRRRENDLQKLGT